MSAAYRVLVSRRVRKQISRIDRSHQLRIRAALDLLATQPRPPKCVALSGFESIYRVKVGDYRILYSVHDEIRVIAVIRVGWRVNAEIGDDTELGKDNPCSPHCTPILE